ncbi:MAG: polyprenyl synthetase family protein [Chitinophagaceae bacterium]|nr:MAG: polyprenyl synthetase family protein [Chitinophagaceae bacterium]
MQSFEQLSAQFADYFNTAHFPGQPSSLYGPNEYFLSIGGKRVRPVLCLMGNELFAEISQDAWQVGTAIELFHNFSLIHDDIMDKAPLRRGMETVHLRFGESTAILAGDVMLVKAYEYLNKVSTRHIHGVMDLFNQTAREVCEGQQLDMDFEKLPDVAFETYLEMIGLKTSVLLAASLQLGAILGGAGEGNQQHIYAFGKKLGLAFQVQDDYLDAFGDPGKFGKQVGGDILSNKKTFLLIHALQESTGEQRERLEDLLAGNAPGKVAQVLDLYRECEVDKWAMQLKDRYLDEALQHLEDIAVMNIRKQPLRELARFLVQRDY